MEVANTSKIRCLSLRWLLVPAQISQDHLYANGCEPRTSYLWWKVELRLVEGGTTTDEMVFDAVLTLRGQTAWPFCYLAGDWSIESLVEIVWNLQGHHFEGRLASSAPEVIFRALCDFDLALRRVHRVLPTSAIACFFQSWQVHEHVTTLCDELKESTTARRLQAHSTHWDDAKWKIRRLMNGYAREMLILDYSPESTPATASVIQMMLSPGTSSVEPQVNDDLEGEVVTQSETNDRRAMVDAYIDEVLEAKSKRISKTDIWKAAGYKDRTEFDRWQSYWHERKGRKPNKAANKAFTRVLTVTKPHLK